MAADLTDPELLAAYESVVSNGDRMNWFIMSYGQSRDKLSVWGSGTKGVKELHDQIPVDDVYFAFLREENSFILISLFPEAASGVRRARALVHTKAITSFLRATDATWTVTKPSEITAAVVRSKLCLGSPSLYSSQSDSDNTPSIPDSPIRTHSPLFASASRTLLTPTPPSPPSANLTPRSLTPTMPRSPRSPVRSFTTPTLEYKKDAPLPPTPPKDDPLPVPPAKPIPKLRIPSRKPVPTTRQVSADAYVPPSRDRGFSMASMDSAYSEYVDDMQGRSWKDMLVQVNKDLPLPSDQYAPRRTAAQQHAAQSRAKWAAEADQQQQQSSPVSPRPSMVSIHRSPSEMRRRREAEDAELIRQEAELAARRKFEKEEEMRQLMDEEERRRAETQEIARRAASARLIKEQRRREEEEIQAMETEMKRLRERERRLDEARKAEERRREDKRLAESKAAQEEEARRVVDEEKQTRMLVIQRRFDKLRKTEETLLTGFVTAQASDSVVWKRRFFMLKGNELLLYKNAVEVNKPLDTIKLGSRVSGVREPHEGFEELRAIPHSFALEFKDEAPWQFFTDTDEDKGVLFTLLSQSMS